MEHILTTYNARPREYAWSLANKLWRRRDKNPIPTRLGDIIGCGLAGFSKNGKPVAGKNRLYRILVSETAYLIWKMRNERRIRDNDPTECTTTDSEIYNRWTHTINKRLTTDRALTNGTRFKKRAMDAKLVQKTWRGCLKNEEDLPTDWYRLKGVLVGIASTRPQRRDRCR